MNKRLLGVAAAALLAVVGTVLVLTYVRGADDRAQADTELVEVYVYEDGVSAGSDATSLRRAIGTERVQAGTVVDGVLTDLRQLDGKVAAVDLVAGEQVLLSRLIEEASYNGGNTRLTSVPDGMHEMTISLSPERMVGGRLEPGDTAGVIVTMGESTIGGVNGDDNPTPEELLSIFESADEVLEGIKQVPVSHFLLQHVLVTRVQVEELPQERTDSDGNPIDTGALAPTGNLLVTFALETEDAERMAFSAEFGLIWLTYEPADSADHPEDMATRENLYGHSDTDEGDLISSDVSTEEVPS